MTREIRSDKNKNLEKHKPVQNDISNMNNNSNNNTKEKTSYFDKLGANNINIFSQLKQSKYSIKQKANSKNSTNHIRSSSVLNIKNNNTNNPNENYQYYLNKLKATTIKLGNNRRQKQESNQHHKMNRVNSASKIQSQTSSEFNFSNGIPFANRNKKNSNYNSNMKYNYIK